MKEDFVTYELAVKLKEKGFSEKCLYHYIDNKLVSNTCKSDNDNITTEDLLMSCNYLVSQFDIVGSNVVVSDAPTIPQVLKWLRDKRIYCLPYFEQGIDMWLYAICKPAFGCEFPEFISKSDYDTYEQAALAGIEYVLDNLI